MSYDERITTYYGDAVMRAGFLPIPHLLMRHYAALDLNADQAMFAMQLMAITWDLAQPPDTMKKLAQRMGVSLRTAQRYSEQLSERGLLIVYEQFQAGAQVENGYDLSPLFDRLAAFAPEPRPGGAPRERRVRAGGPPSQPSVADDTRVLDVELQRVSSRTALSDSGEQLPHVTNVIPSHVTSVIPPHDTHVTRPDVSPVTPGPTPVSGLKEETKNLLKNKPKRNKQQKNAAVVGKQDDRKPQRADQKSEQTGHSRRWNILLTTQEVTASHDALQQIGLNSLVVDTTAPTLHPAEIWALWCYARGADLGTGWIASQIFDFDAREARSTSQGRGYEEAGKLLSAMSPQAAEMILDMIDTYCPHAPDDLKRDPRCIDADAAQWAALEAVWAARVDQSRSPQRGGSRGAPNTPVPLAQSSQLGLTSATPMDHDPLWLTVRARLEEHVAPSDFATWIEPLALLELQDDVAFVGAPNVFVRNAVVGQFAPLIAATLSADLDHPVQVEVVIDASANMPMPALRSTSRINT